ncbi:serine--tRNA ligase [Pelagibacterales bacterium SAG-MED23]|nr:serine--tRNA ligase [Pelagibacterales bacterium SAG-MED23]
MHNIKDIRKDFENFKDKLKNRNVDISLYNIISLDEKNRKLIQEKEKFEMEKKNISKSKDQSLFEKSKELSLKIEEINKNQIKLQTQITDILSSIPNIPLSDVPVGQDENSNKEIEKKGEIKDFNFKPKTHYELGDKLNMLDFDLATKTTGSRFVFVKKELAQLERAISNFMIDTHTQKNGYTEISPPLIATAETMFGTGQLPKFENDQFEIKLDESEGRKFLIPTAEVILTNIVKNQILEKNELPIRVVASTPCFRKEAGSYGKDTKGMIRQHQFYKVELVSIVENDKCSEELERMSNSATMILDALKLPYRKIVLCTGDMGFSAEKTYDIEVWLPSENKYREISSCSSCGTFQARRMKARYKGQDSSKEFVGTLNGSGLAVGRTMIAIMENYQTEDGSILIPEVLKPYMPNIDKISIN